MFPLSIKSSTFSIEVLKTKISSLIFNILSRKFSTERKFAKQSLQYIYSNMSKMDKIAGLVLSKLMFWHERFLDHSLSEI